MITNSPNYFFFLGNQGIKMLTREAYSANPGRSLKAFSKSGMPDTNKSSDVIITYEIKPIYP
jgi:hypothetical protein